MSSKQAILSSFIESAPPGELQNVVTDLQALSSKQQVDGLGAAFEKYHEEQYTTVKPPGSSEPVLISEHNALGHGRYFDTAGQSSFKVQAVTQQVSDSQQHPLESEHADLIKSLQKSFSAASAEHFPSYTIGVYPNKAGHGVAALLVANKYSPTNYWNGRWRSVYLIQPSGEVSGQIQVDVHYYEDGNVRMSTKKEVELSGSGGADKIVREIAKAENAFQTELNKAFINLAEGSFKGLRRQLPVTRQRVEWEKIGGYRLGQDIGGGRVK